jgi:molecular chaperone IbpA
MWIMSVINFSPAYRPASVSIGAPNLFRSSPLRTYPAYDVEKTGEQAYRLTLAVPGFRIDDLAIATRPNELIVTGKHRENIHDRHVHRGFVSHGFERRFDLDNHVEVTGASLADGLLTIDLERRVPKAMQSRTVRIKGKPAKPTLIGRLQQSTAAAFGAVARRFARARSPRSAA